MEVLRADRSRCLGPPRPREQLDGGIHRIRIKPQRYRVISSTFFFLFSQLGVGMMLTLLFISPRSIGNSFFKFASLTAAILLGVTLGFNLLFPSLARESQIPVVFLVISAVLTALYNRIVDVKKFTVALALLIAATVTGLISVAADALSFTRLMSLGG